MIEVNKNKKHDINDITDIVYELRMIRSEIEQLRYSIEVVKQEIILLKTMKRL